MTEEDTIRKLKRWTYEELEKAFAELRNKYTSGKSRQTDMEFWRLDKIALAHKAGWTFEEYQLEHLRRIANKWSEDD